MATRTDAAERAREQQDIEEIPSDAGSLRLQFYDETTGLPIGQGPVLVPVADANPKNLELLLNTLQGHDSSEYIPYRFTLPVPDKKTSEKITTAFPTNIYKTLITPGLISTEEVQNISAAPQAVFRKIEIVLSGHKGSVSCVRWGGTGFIYTGSHDKTVKVWNAKDGTLAHSLNAHAHWVNHLALSTDFVMRTAYHDHTGKIPPTDESKLAQAQERFLKASRIQGEVVERLVSASDDFTMYLWEPSKSSKPIARLLGHQKQVNHVTFSPDGLLIASSGFDNHTKIWNARDGKFINTLRGHVAPVYQCAFSPDSRLLVTGSKDTTLKVWDMRTYKLAEDLPGHKDEVYAVDWSPDGQKVASGGKDKAVRIWRH
ncbi:wd repeat protein [Rutstroemia sp. NJR-2017a BVV2]|nr:wd repeat protein [Rutstroemia sp. NJR-2017a BVV2]PQE18408.1 wd repeat protein [Rutstroemia sp. NJR-2017a BVV2]